MGDAPVVPLKDGDCRFWTVVASDGAAVTFRENVGKWSLQDRLDGFLKDGQNDLGSFTQIDHIEAASEEQIAHWIKTHAWVPTLKAFA